MELAADREREGGGGVHAGQPDCAGLCLLGPDREAPEVGADPVNLPALTDGGCAPTSSPACSSPAIRTSKPRRPLSSSGTRSKNAARRSFTSRATPVPPACSGSASWQTQASPMSVVPATPIRPTRCHRRACGGCRARRRICRGPGGPRRARPSRAATGRRRSSLVVSPCRDWWRSPCPCSCYRPRSERPRSTTGPRSGSSS